MVNKMKIIILNCDFDPEEDTTGSALLKKYLGGVSEKIEVFNSYENVFPEDDMLRSASHVVITGSRSSVYENHDWIRNMEFVVRKLDLISMPTLGICFGFQIVAKALRGHVESSGSFEEGFQKISLTREGLNNRIFQGFPRQFNVYQSHGDVVRALPEGSVILAESNRQVEAFAVKNFYCVQFHPEILPETAAIMALRDNMPLERIFNSVGSDYTLPTGILFNFMSSMENNPSCARRKHA